MSALTTVPDTTVRCACGHRNAPGSRFCSGCGRPLLAGTSLNELTCAFFLDTEFEPVRLAACPPRDRSGRAELLVCQNSLAVRRFVLEDEPTTLGRAPESGILLDDFTVSRRHAHLAPVPEGYLIRDLGSLNGTYVNRERVEERVLADGDELRVGGFALVYRAAASLDMKFRPDVPAAAERAPGGPTPHRKRSFFDWSGGLARAVERCFSRR